MKWRLKSCTTSFRRLVQNGNNKRRSRAKVTKPSYSSSCFQGTGSLPLFVWLLARSYVFWLGPSTFCLLSFAFCVLSLYFVFWGLLDTRNGANARQVGFQVSQNWTSLTIRQFSTGINPANKLRLVITKLTKVQDWGNVNWKPHHSRSEDKTFAPYICEEIGPEWKSNFLESNDMRLWDFCLELAFWWGDTKPM